MRKKILFFLLISFCSFLQAKIIEIFSITELLNYIKEKECLVVFDIDNTLMESVHQLGSDQWFDRRVNILVTSGIDTVQAVKKAYREWYMIQGIIEFKLVEEKTKSVFDQVKKSTDTIALTTRGFDSSYPTISALNSLGIVFDDKPMDSSMLFFQNEGNPAIFPGVLFLKGILFTSNTHKGEALFKLLGLIKKQPKQVIFINDKLAHLKQVEESSEKRSIPFIGLRYGYTDERVKNIDSRLLQISDLQLRQLVKELEKQALIVK